MNHDTNVQRDNEIKSPHDLDLRRCEWSAKRSCRFAAWETPNCRRLDGSHNRSEKKNLAPDGNRNLAAQLFAEV
jgi:hypothetical protein